MALSALLLGVFTVSAGYGLVLPQIRNVVRAASPGVPSDIALHAGALTGLYMLAVAVFAPFWGRLSDRHGRRPVLLAGLIGFAFSMIVFTFVRGLPQLYAERFLSGLFAAAIAPVAAAYVADIAPTDQWRASRLAWINMASIAGFVLGPMLAAAAALGAPVAGQTVRPLSWPFLAAGLLAVLAAGLVARTLRATAPPSIRTASQAGEARSLEAVLLGLTFVIALTVGVFEVGVALRGGRLVTVTPAELAMMFTVCSLVMFAAQAILFSPLVRAERTWRVLAPGFFLTAIALFLVPVVTGPGPAVAVVALLAASAGSVSPALAYWLSISTGRGQGVELGKQTAAASLGQAAGSVAGGALLNAGAAGADPFLLAGAIALAGALAALLVSRRLAALKVSAG
jgi:MFS family permease